MKDTTEKKIKEAKELLIQATKLLSDIAEERNSEETDLEDWTKDRVQLWCRIYNEGGIVTIERLNELWKQMGKDPRGLGGFFTGRGASLAYTSDDKVALMQNASKSIEAWTGKPISEYAKKFKD